MAGLLERDADENVFNCYVTVGVDGFISKFHKLHPFVNPHLSPGNGFQVIDLLGCRVGFMICYDNNLPENGTDHDNARCRDYLHAARDVLPAIGDAWAGDGRSEPVGESRPRPGAAPPGVSRSQRTRLADALVTGAGPTKNGIYAVFTNPIGWDYDTVKPGLAMILDPYGEVLVESPALKDDVVVGLLTPDKFEGASGRRYLKARRPELYDKLVQPQASVTLPGWKMEHQGK